ncbi:hypothetical protein G3N59_05535 [Paraburkholderia sp. Ac-20340]|uniref:hypothetical protein n=1 Tax=Paraburkholderia sp. Ac-20340 TaxID=2703888 RepID=UPI001981DF73|nr:hypothetical protein [Paraburkholderia sp. Ac-20340]MBN3852837.1 hypothetical protein [Paraburkholderia sp. Ac-20340]
MKRTIVGSAALALAVAACGGNGNSDEPTPDLGAPVVSSLKQIPEGFYTGAVTSKFVGDPAYLLVRPDGTAWALTAIGVDLDVESERFAIRPTLKDGVIAGTARAYGENEFVAYGVDGYDNKEYPPIYQGMPSIAVTGKYDSATKTVSMNLAAVGPVSFDVTPANPADFDYNTPAKASDIAGTWQLWNAGEMNVSSLTVAADGTISGTQPGKAWQFNPKDGTYGGTDTATPCSVSGYIRPSADGKNLFDVHMVYTGETCVHPGETASGVAIYQTLPAGTILNDPTVYHRLWIAAEDDLGTGFSATMTGLR